MACYFLKFIEVKKAFSSSKVKDMIFPRTRHSVCSDGRYLFASGSADLNERESKIVQEKNKRIDPKTVEMYDPRKDLWKQMPDLNLGRSNHSSCCLNKSLYIFCGFDSTL